MIIKAPNLATNNPLIANVLTSNVRQLTTCTTRHSANIEAKKNRAAAMSEVITAPLASIVGHNANNTRLTNAAPVPIKRRAYVKDQSS